MDYDILTSFVKKASIYNTWYRRADIIIGSLSTTENSEWFYRITDGFQGNMFRIEAHKVLRYTPAGCWVDNYGKEKFINFSHKKQFAHKTFEEALTAYKKRKDRQILILRAQLKRAEEHRHYINEISLEDIVNAAKD